VPRDKTPDFGLKILKKGWLNGDWKRRRNAMLNVFLKRNYTELLEVK
jgi:hypothetical protein